MCHTVTTKSVHCVDPSHSLIRDVPCEKTMLRSLKSASVDAWAKLSKCSRRHRPIVTLLAVECEQCKNAPAKAWVDPWGCDSDESLGWWDIKSDDTTPESINSDDDTTQYSGTSVALDEACDAEMRSSNEVNEINEINEINESIESIEAVESNQQILAITKVEAKSTRNMTLLRKLLDPKVAGFVVRDW